METNPLGEAEMNALIDQMPCLFEKAIAAIGETATWDQVEEYCVERVIDELVLEDIALQYSAWLHGKPDTVAYVIVPNYVIYGGEDDEVRSCVLITARANEDAFALAVAANIDECERRIQLFRIRNHRPPKATS